MSTSLPAGRSRAGLIFLACAEAVWLAILLALPLVMNVSLVRTFEASKLGAVAPLAALGLGALAAGSLAGGFAGMRKLLASAPVLCFTALIAIAVLATAASETPWVAFFGDYFRREGLLSWLTYGVLFGALLLALRRREQVERIIDVLLLSTVIPCVYAVMQRYGYDFFVTHGLLVGTAGARPGGTMGNPVFLASLLLLIIPVTAARLLAPGEPTPASAVPSRGYPALSRACTLLLLGLQVFTVILSQSRGPELGLAVALAVSMLLVGAWQRHRLPIAIALIGSLAAGAGVAALNLVPALALSVRGTPLQRLVFSGDGLSVDSRIGIWQAGVNAFLHAPWQRQWLGWGPDAASFSYFQWIPAVVQRTEGYAETIDRVHSQFLEVLMTFGILGLAMHIALLAALVWTAAGRLLPAPTAAMPARIGFIALNLAGMLLGAGLAYGASGSPGLLPIGAGAGLAAAWILFLAWRAWRGSLPAGALPAAAISREDGMLIVALVGALIGSWVETLVGVPTIATLSVAAVYAALLILGAHGAWRRSAPAAAPGTAAAPAAAQAGMAPGRKTLKQRRPEAQTAAPRSAPQGSAAYPILGWAVALCLMIAVVDFFPPLTGTRILSPSVLRLSLIVWPLALVALGGFAMAFVEAGRSSADAQSTLTRFLLWCVPPALLLTIVYFSLGDSLREIAQDDLADCIAALVELGYAACLVMTLLLAGALYRAAEAPRAGMRRSGWAVPATLAAGAALSVATFLAVRADVRADVRSKLAVWAQGQGQTEAALRFTREALALVPAERRYASTYAGRLVEAAVADAPALAARPQAGAALVEKFREAERILAAAMARAPRDPWLAFGYANTEVHLASPLLAPILPPAERALHAAQARKYFALAHQEFPGQAWFLRGWVQLEIDQGNRAGAYAKLTEMEQLDPRNISAYPDWVSYARFGGKALGEAVAAVRRGLDVMPKGSDEAAALLEMQIEMAREAGQPRQALSAALEATATDPERIRPWLQLADLYEQAGQRGLALSNAQNAVARFAGRSLAGNDAADLGALRAQAARLAASTAVPVTAVPGAPALPAGK
jgi:O-antigen ligase